MPLTTAQVHSLEQELENLPLDEAKARLSFQTAELRDENRETYIVRLLGVKDIDWIDLTVSRSNDVVLLAVVQPSTLYPSTRAWSPATSPDFFTRWWRVGLVFFTPCVFFGPGNEPHAGLCYGGGLIGVLLLLIAVNHLVHLRLLRATIFGAGALGWTVAICLLVTLVLIYDIQPYEAYQHDPVYRVWSPVTNWSSWLAVILGVWALVDAIRGKAVSGLPQAASIFDWIVDVLVLALVVYVSFLLLIPGHLR